MLTVCQAATTATSLATSFKTAPPIEFVKGTLDQPSPSVAEAPHNILTGRGSALQTSICWLSNYIDLEPFSLQALQG